MKDLREFTDGELQEHVQSLHKELKEIPGAVRQVTDKMQAASAEVLRRLEKKRAELKDKLS